jgi:hypothetical protein
LTSCAGEAPAADAPVASLSTSSIRTQVTPAGSSPSIETIVSVILAIISCFCSLSNTPLMSLTLTIGM